MIREQKEMVSLESLGFPKHYIGLRWYNISVKEPNTHIKNLQSKHEESHGLLVHGSDIDENKATSIGFANEMSSRYYSAAAIVCKAISESYPNAFFIQKLPNGRFWYLLIKDHVPVGYKNDLILDDAESVTELMNEHYQLFELDEVKLRYVVPREITELVSDLFNEDISLYQDLDYETINDAINDLRFAQIKAVDSLIGLNPLAKLPKKAIVVCGVIIAGIVGFTHFGENTDTDDLLYDLDAIAAKAVKKSNQRIITSSNRNDPNSSILAADIVSATEEEAKWVSQRLVASNPTHVLTTFVAYVKSLPVNVSGWYPEKVQLRLKPTISREFSSIGNHADIEMFHQIVVTWRNGGSSVANFRDATQFNGQILYLLNGQIIETTTVKPLGLSTQNFEPLEAVTFIADTKGKYLDILSFVQDEMRENPSRFTGNIKTSVRKQREIPFKNLMYEHVIDQSQIEYTTLELNLNTNGYGWSFKNLSRLASQLDEFPHLILTFIDLNLETEEVKMSLQYIHDKSILNSEEVEKNL